MSSDSSSNAGAVILDPASASVNLIGDAAVIEEMRACASELEDLDFDEDDEDEDEEDEDSVSGHRARQHTDSRYGFLMSKIFGKCQKIQKTAVSAEIFFVLFVLFYEDEDEEDEDLVSEHRERQNTNSRRILLGNESNFGKCQKSTDIIEQITGVNSGSHVCFDLQ